MEWMRMRLPMIGLLMACFVGLAATVGAQEPDQQGDAEQVVADEGEDDSRLITMNFQDIELSALVKFISEITGKNFILDERVKGKVTIISPEKITEEEAYAVFQSVLQVKGFATVPSGAVYKVLPAQEAKSTTLETVLPQGSIGGSDEVITKLLPMQNVDVNNMLPIIQPLVSPNGLLAAYVATNTLILIDSAANIDRIARILHVLDVEGQDRGVEVLRLNYAFATEIAALLGQVLDDEEEGAVTAPQTGGASAASRARSTARSRRSRRNAQQESTTAITGGGETVAYKIIPDERTNTLVVVAGPLEMRRIKDLVVRLDVPLPHGTGRIHVYYLKHANSFEIVPVLSDLIGATGGGLGGLGGGLLSRRLGGSTAARGGRLGQRGGLAGAFGADSTRSLGSFSGSAVGRSTRGQSGGFGSLGGGGLGGGGFAQGGAAGGVSSVTGGGNSEFAGEVRITADPSTNALIINASPQDYETLKQVIEKLDVPRRQVYVEAIVMEVRLERDSALGIELQGGLGLDSGVGIARNTSFGGINSLVSNPGSLPGLILAAASNQTIRLPDGTVIPAQVALLTAARSDTNANILSAPNILTTDNQEAEIVVGENVPFIASRSTSATNLDNTFATVDRRDVGITLRITPQISQGGMVRLDIFQEVSDVVDSAVSGIDVNLLGPTTTIRSATTSVVVRDGHTVVIGGLIGDRKDNSENGVPYISDIPIIGNFFTSFNARQEKGNLLIFLTPHIVRNPMELRDSSLEKRDKLKAFMAEHRFRDMRPETLDAGSWTPDLQEFQNAPKAHSGLLIERPGDETMKRYPADESMKRPDLEPPPDADVPPPATRKVVDGTGSDASLDLVELRPPQETAGARYVLLASFAQSGTPPPALQSNSGLLAIELPENSRLSKLFRQGQQYRFSSDTYNSLYHVLETYRSLREAQLVYPEGMPVDPDSGEYLHWRELKDPSSANASAWTALH
jgi:general secretion pathway protein D